MKIIKLTFCLLTFSLIYSCDYVESPDDTANVSEGFITFPALNLVGDQLMTIGIGEPFEDPGVIATLGQDDISSDVVVTGSVENNASGVYILDYDINVTNELGDESAVNRRRYVAVVTEDANSIDLSGVYAGDGTAISGAWTQNATVSRSSGAWYNIDKALASGNNLGIFFAVVGSGDSGGPSLIVPDQVTPFGSANSTDEGTNAQINSNGFQWTIFISCCGNFGPIIYSM